MQQGAHPTTEQVATALAARACGASQREAGGIADTSHTTVRRWEKGENSVEVAGEAASLVPAKSASFRSEWAELRKSAVAKIDEKKLQAASALQLATVAGIADDKIARADAALAGQGHEKGSFEGLAATAKGRETIIQILRLGSRLYDIEAEAVELPLLEGDTITNVGK